MNRLTQPGGPDHPGQPSRRPAVVLIADDSKDAREMYALYLKHCGFSTYTTPDGSGAVEIALDVRPDVVVMDFSMPFVDGLTATQRLKSHPDTREIPVILLTGHPSRAVERGAIEAGADKYLTKPCLPEDLEHHVRQLLRRPCA
jgi:CheY-like chemotaxis protein